MKEYTCVQVGDHKDIANTIDEYQHRGWRLHTYACAGGTVISMFPPRAVHHYLLFEKGEETQRKTTS